MFMPMHGTVLMKIIKKNLSKHDTHARKAVASCLEMKVKLQIFTN